MSASGTWRRSGARRWSAAILAVTAIACGSERAPEPRSIERFVERSGTAACVPRPDPSGNGWVVEDLVATSDSTFLVVYPFDRRIGHYHDDLSVDFVLAFDEDGPRGVGEARSATLVDDSLVYIADRARRRIRILHRDGGDRGTLRTDFAPYVIRSGASGTFVGAFVFGSAVPGSAGSGSAVSGSAVSGSAGETLVYAIEAGALRPLPIPAVSFEDLRVGALANLLEITPLDDGTVVAAHQLILSRAFVIRPEAGGFGIRETTVPIPDSERSRLGEVPGDLFEHEERINEVAVPVLGATPDLAAGGYLYLTRSGRDLPEGGREKAIVRAGLDGIRGGLAYEASWVLDVNAMKIVYLANRRSALVIDDESRWYECPLD